MKGLTKNQQRVLDYYEQEAIKRKVPTQRDIASNLNMHLKTVSLVVKALKTKGYITNDSGKSRSVSVVNSSFDIIEVPILGTIAAGSPLLTEESYDGSLSVSSTLLDTKYKHFALKVKGDSMDKEGILDGDFAILKEANSARLGQIVACSFDSEHGITLKEFGGVKNGTTTLYPRSTNPKHSTLRNSEVRIFGTLVMIIREY